jgi:hypothetical protein
MVASDFQREKAVEAVTSLFLAVFCGIWAWWRIKNRHNESRTAEPAEPLEPEGRMPPLFWVLLGLIALALLALMAYAIFG